MHTLPCLCKQFFQHSQCCVFHVMHFFLLYHVACHCWERCRLSTFRKYQKFKKINDDFTYGQCQIVSNGVTPEVVLYPGIHESSLVCMFQYSGYIFLHLCQPTMTMATGFFVCVCVCVCVCLFVCMCLLFFTCTLISYVF